MSKVQSHHLQKPAYIYVRQSTMGQVRHHQKSIERQYDLRNRAVEMMWAPERIRILDQDLGQSGARTTNREDFKTLVADPFGPRNVTLVRRTGTQSTTTRSRSGSPCEHRGADRHHREDRQRRRVNCRRRLLPRTNRRATPRPVAPLCAAAGRPVAPGETFQATLRGRRAPRQHARAAPAHATRAFGEGTRWSRYEPRLAP